MKRQFLTIALVMVLVLAAIGSAGAKEIVIGVSLLTRNDVHFNDIEDAIVAKSAELGVKVIIQDANSDSNRQMNHVQNFIVEGVDAIVLSPVDSGGIDSALALAKEANIPVFTIDIPSNNPAVISHIGTDNYKGGWLAGEYAAKVLDGTGKVAVITYSEVQSCVDREIGFIEYLKQNCPDIEVVDIQNSSAKVELGATIAEDMMLKFPDLALIFGNGDPWALSAYQAIKVAGEDIKVIGFSATDMARDEIRKNEGFVASIAQKPKAMGAGVIEAAVDYLNGKPVNKESLIAPVVVDIANVDE